MTYGYFQGRKIYRLNDAVTNISCGIVEQLTGLFAKVFTVAAYHFIFTRFAIFELADVWYWLVLCFIGVDFFYYWAHRMSHEVNLFWLGHVVHHQSEDYNLSVALRQSVFQKMFTFYFYFPLALFGFKTEWFVLMGAFNLLYQFWIHTEVIKKLPAWYEYVFNTPSHHRVHHGRNPKYIDRNHAGTLMIWDRMFGTFQVEDEEPIYGITTPTDTWNPVMANVQPFMRLYAELKGIPGFVNKVKFIFAPPGWYPKELGGFKSAPQVDRASYQKFEIKVSPGLNIYLMAQYILVLLITSLFLFNVSVLQGWEQAAVATIVVISVAMIGLIFENKPRAIAIEFSRFALVLILTFYLVQQSYIPFWFFGGLAIWSFASLLTLGKVRFHSLRTAKG